MSHSTALLLAGAYTIAAMACLLAGTREWQAPASRRYASLLFLLTIVLWMIGLQHASGGFSGITNAARELSRTEGWYQDRRDLQAEVIRAIPLAGLAAAAGLLWWIRRVWRRYLPVLITLLFLVCFSAIQAVSFHDMDALMRTHYGGITVQTWANLLGLLLTIVAVVPFLGKKRE